MFKFYSLLKIKKNIYHLKCIIRNNCQHSEASTMILIAKNDSILNDKNGYNYRLLMAKRSSKSSFMSNAYIFPGGKLDDDDFNTKWIQIFDNFNIDIKGNRPSLIKDSVTKKLLVSKIKTDQLFEADLALRICAIRETYEETGILLAKNNNKTGNEANCQQNDAITEYRDKLRNNQIKFSDLCIKQNIKPDVYSLYEWSNWMTPKIESKRFDTLFYIAFVDSEPETHIDNKELTKLQWSTPEEMLNNYNNNNDILLAPPQVYELSRLLNMKDFNQLKTFASEREKLGLEQWMPRIVLKDEKQKMDLFDSDFIIILAGDYEDKNCTNKTVEHNRIIAKNTANGRKFSVQCNIELDFGQLSPLN